MDSKRYLEIIGIPFILLVIVNLLYPFFGYTAFSLFSHGVFSLFSFFGVVSSLIAIVIYSYVTWRVIKERDSTPAEAAIAGALLSISVSVVSYAVGIIATLLVIFLNLEPTSLFSTTLINQFVAQYLTPLNFVLGVLFGVIVSFLGGFFGFIWGKIQPMFRPILKSVIKEGKIRRKNIKRIESTARAALDYSIEMMRDGWDTLWKKGHKKGSINKP